MRERLRGLLRDPLLALVALVTVASVVVVVVMALVGEGWGNGDLKTWDTWLGGVQKLATIVGIAGGAYIAYRRLIGGGGVLTPRCTLELSASLRDMKGDS